LRDYKPLYATLISGDIILDPIKEFLIDIDILYGRLNDLSKTYKKEKLFATESELNARILTEHDTMLTELPEYIIDIFYKKGEHIIMRKSNYVLIKILNVNHQDNLSLLVKSFLLIKSFLEYFCSE
jgi:hypothetical protein